jgi:hypothetical protein
MTLHPVIGVLSQSPSSAMAALLTSYNDPNPFMEFDTGQIIGLARLIDGGIEILAVQALNPGLGHFRLFIAQLKAHYRSISVLELWNPWLAKVLVRYGFAPLIKQDRSGESVTGYQWLSEIPENLSGKDLNRVNEQE